MEWVRNLYDKLGLERFAYIGYFILCFFLFAPIGIRNYADYMYSIFKWMLLICSGYYVVLHLLMNFSAQYIKKLAKDNCVFLIMLAYFFLVNLVIAPERVVPETAKLFLPAFCLMLLFEHDNLMETKFWNVLVFYCREMLMVNFLITIFFPEGVFRADSSATYERANWLFGSRNNMAVFLILFFAIVYIDNLYNRKKNAGALKEERNRDFLDNIFLSAFYAIYPVIMCGDDNISLFEGSSTGMISVALLMVLIILVEILYATDKKWLDKILDARIWYTVILALSVGILVGSRSTGTFAKLTSFFGKSPTFTGRSYVWNTAIDYIAKSPIFGYGEVDLLLRIIPTTGLEVSYAYSGILRILLSYGAIGLILFLAFLYKPFIKGHGGIMQKACMCGICALLVVGMMNEYDDLFIIALVFLADTVQKQMVVEEEKTIAIAEK